MGKGTGLIVFYNEISDMYLKITSSNENDNYNSESWALMIDANGESYHLCSVRKTYETEQDWSDIRKFIQLKAPNIRIR